MTLLVVEVGKPARLHLEILLSIFDFYTRPIVEVIRNPIPRISPKSEPQLVVFNERENLLICNGVYIADNQKLLIILDKL